MRKWIAWILAALLLSGCAGQTPQEQDNTQVRVGVCLRGDLDSAGYQQVLTAAMESHGWQVSVVDAGLDQSLQDLQIRELTEEGTSLLIIEPVMTDAAEQLVQQLQEANMPAVFIGRQPPEDALSGWEKVCYAGGSENPGEAQVQLVLQSESRGDLNGDGVVTYCVLAGDEDLQVTQDALLTYETLLPGSTLLEAAYTPLTQESGKQQCQRMLAEFGPDLEVLFCHSDVLALGAAEVIRAEGRAVGTDLLLIGNGGSREALEQVRDDRLTGTVLLSSQALADTVTEAAALLLQGSPVESHYPVEWTCVDKKTAAVLLK